MKATSIVAGIVVVIVLGLGAWYLLGRTNTSDTNVTPPSPSSTEPTTPSTSTSCLPAASLPKTMTIEYRNGQFFGEGAEEASDTFCVPKGGAVTFKGENLWVASTPHPIHNDLPGFDAKAAMASYSFTFDKVGEWGLHNHLRPSDTGTIIVVE